MWVFTKDGFFSVVNDKYCGPDELMVRTRTRADAERIRDMLAPGSDVIVLGHADYRYRVKVGRQAWADYLHDTAQDLDYPTVKDTISMGDQKRGICYFAIWSQLVRFQRDEAIRNGDWQDMPIVEL